MIAVAKTSDLILYWDLDYNALYSTGEENDTIERKRKRLDALEAQKKSKII